MKKNKIYMNNALIKNFKKRQIRKLFMGAQAASKRCKKPDILEGFTYGINAVLDIINAGGDDDLILKVAAYHRKTVSHLAGAKKEHWESEDFADYLSEPDENWVVR